MDYRLAMRKMWHLSTPVILIGLLLACSATAQRLQQVADGFNSPVVITNAGDERIFVVEQRGVIKVITGGEVQEAPYLDIRSQVSSGGERGLLGLAFPDDHARTKRFYVYYTDSNGDTVVSRFQADGNVADPNSEQILLTQQQPFGNHNGRPMPTFSEKAKSSNSLPNFLWSRFLASSNSARYSVSSFCLGNVIP